MSARGRQRRRFSAGAIAAMTLAVMVTGGCSGRDGGRDVPQGSPTAVEESTVSTAADDDAASDPPAAPDDDQDGGANGDTGDGLQTTAGSTIPPDFPQDVPLPPGYAVSLATVTTGEGGRTVVVQLRAPGDPATTLQQLATSLESAGWTRLQLSTTDVDGSTAGSATFSKDAALLHIGTVTGTEPASVSVSYSLLPDGGTPTTVR